MLIYEYFFLSSFSIISDTPIASSLPFLKQFNLIFSPSALFEFSFFPSLFSLFEIIWDRLYVSYHRDDLTYTEVDGEHADNITEHSY